MRSSVQMSLLLAGFGLAGLVLSEGEAAGRSGKKKKAKHSHSHSHDHSHGDEGKGKSEERDHGHSHSPYFLGVGLSIAQGFGGGGGSSGGSSGGHGHSHGLRGDDALALDEGHSHAGGAEGEGESGGSKGPSIELTTTAGYRLTKELGLNLGLGYTVAGGIGDPSLGVAYEQPLAKKLGLAASFSATAPVSKASRDTYKITKLTLGAGPNWRRGKWTLEGGLRASKTYYSKTIIIEGEEGEDHDHEHALQDDDHGDEHAIDSTAGGTGDREFDRYALESNASYKLAARWRLGFGLEFAYITHQFGASTIETSATVARGTYTWKSLAFSLGLTATGEGESFTAPTQPGASASVFYTLE